jgi:hypothetical protein
MRNLDGWMTERMTGRMDGKDDHHGQTKDIIYIKIDIPFVVRGRPTVTEGS